MARLQWTDTDSVYGSRELAARLAVSGDLKRITSGDPGGHDRPVQSADPSRIRLDEMADGHDLAYSRSLGLPGVFVSEETSTQDDHLPFLHRGVPAVDIIDLGGLPNQGYWHTPQDTLDKISPRSLAIVGHVILESVAELQKR